MSIKARTPEQTLYNNKRNMLNYHVKTAKNEEERNKVMNTINSLKFIYNLNTIVNQYLKIDKIEDEEQKETLKGIISRLSALIEEHE